MNMNANDFLDLMDDGKQERSSGLKPVVRFGYIDASYTTGAPRIVFDAADSASVKTYPYLDGYTPTANDRVIVLNDTILGKIRVN